MKLAVRGCCALVAFVGSIPLLAAEPQPLDRGIPEVVDYYIDQRLAEAGVVPAPPASPENYVRRLTLDLAGRIPTVAEVRDYLDASQPNRQTMLLDRLLGSPEYVQHQVNEFDTLLMAGTRSSLREYLAKAFAQQRTWDRMFRDLIVPESNPGEREPAQAFLKARIKDHDQLTNDISTIFFGINISCAQCHDHPLVADWKQDHFYGLKSFVNRTFENGGHIGERGYGTVSYLSPDGNQHAARLMFLSGRLINEPATQEPDNAGKKAEQDLLKELAGKKQPPAAPPFSRRAQLPEVALADDHQHYFARAIVNRLWYRLLGYGLVMPIDQMHAGNPASHPELLDWLARDLMAHQYDLNRLIRGLVLSQTYARGSRWDSTERPSPELFAVAQVRPLAPEQLACSLRVAVTDPQYAGSHLPFEERAARMERLSKTARGMAPLFDPVGGEFQVSVTEALLLSNGERIRSELLAPGGDRLINRLLDAADPDECVRLAVWNVWSREPEADELRLLGDYLRAREDRRQAAIEQLLWMLLTGAELRFNH